MQIPIQSLNGVHLKKFPFNFDEVVYSYYLEEEDLYDIQLVLANGQSFVLNKCNYTIPERKRDKKAEEKKEEKTSIEVTEIVTNHKDNTRWITLDSTQYKLCKFIP